MRKICEVCNCAVPLGKNWHSRIKYCSHKCAREAARRRYKQANPNAKKHSSGTTGSIHELKVAIDLLERGFTVFRNISPNGVCDIIALAKDRILKVEVTTGKYTTKGKITYPPHRRSSFDVFAIVTDREIVYLPELTITQDTQDRQDR